MAAHPIEVKNLEDGYRYFRWAGKSTDTKPVLSGMATGSLFHEVDTAKVYGYVEDASSGNEWVEQIALGGSGS